ncbi:MAG: hypothetical protein ACRYHQ_04100 [Janthinobacterium lividum]
MRHASTPLRLAGLAGLVLSHSPVAHAQQGVPGQVRTSSPASNIEPSDTRSVVAPALPVPPVPSVSTPRQFLQAAWEALLRGRSGEAQEALERAETRVLDRSVIASMTTAPDTDRIVLDIAVARRALAAHQSPVALRAIDDALWPSDQAVLPSAVAAYAAPGVAETEVSVPTFRPVVPTTTYALLPGRWELHGATYHWVAADTVPRRVTARSLVPGRYEWRNGAWVWLPVHSGD